MVVTSGRCSINSPYRFNASHGRLGIYEMLPVDEAVQTEILAGAATPRIQAIARRQGVRSLLRDGLAKVDAGRTSLEEVLRAAADGSSGGAGDAVNDR